MGSGSALENLIRLGCLDSTKVIMKVDIVTSIHRPANPLLFLLDNQSANHCIRIAGQSTPYETCPLKWHGIDEMNRL